MISGQYLQSNNKDLNPKFLRWKANMGCKTFIAL